MVTRGIPVSNLQYARGITRAGANDRTRRALYATKLAEQQAASAVSAALSTYTIPPGNVPYAGLYGLGAVDPNTGVDDFGFDLTNDPSTDAPSIPSAGLSNQGTTWTPTYTDGTSGSGNSWSSVLSTFFGGIGSGIGQRIAGQKTVVPVPSSGPSMGTVLLVAGAVAIPMIFLLAKKG
jgi:hypothetical protein